MSDLAIITLAELVDDLERIRIATGNRIGALKRTFGSSASTCPTRRIALPGSPIDPLKGAIIRVASQAAAR